MADFPSEIHQQAIQAALSGDWKRAIALNEEILKVDPKNVDTLNRASHAYFELGEIKKAKTYSRLVLNYDPYNQIALKSLRKIESFRQIKFSPSPASATINLQNLNDLFIEEPGKTKQVALLKVAEPQKLSRLSSGETVNLTLKTKSITVNNQQGEYLGILPDDLSRLLLRFIKGGNKYQTFIKTVKPNGLSVIIREIYRCPRFKNQPSFLDNISLALAYSSEHIIVNDEYTNPEERKDGLGEDEEST